MLRIACYDNGRISLRLDRKGVSSNIVCVFKIRYFYTWYDLVTVESDHKSLETIFKKPLCEAPKRLQRMMMRLQRYNLQVTFKQGKDMLMADTLSRAYLQMTDSQVNALTADENDISRKCHDVSEATWARIERATAIDDQLQIVANYTVKGWPDRRSDCQAATQPYFSERRHLAVQHNCVFRGEQVVMPKALRAELMQITHRTHKGSDSCLKRMREVMYWPDMAAEVKLHVQSCDACI